MSKLTVKELLDWLDDAHSSDCIEDALSKEHPHTGRTPEFWSKKARIRDQAYEQIVEIIRKSE